MEIVGSETKESVKRNILRDRYPTDLNMYAEVPTDEVDIVELQQLAVERVRLLRVFEAVNIKTAKDLPYKEQVIEESMKQSIKFHMPLIKGYVDYESRRLDHLSHFILRLFYCRSDELRKWFIAREVEFFRWKFLNTERKEDIMLFMARNNLHYAMISDVDKRILGKDILSSTAKNIFLDSSHIYKVPYVQVLDLVRGRKVFIKNGIAYVPHQDLNSVLSTVFRSTLSHALSLCAANISIVQQDERLKRILKGLHKSYAEIDYSNKEKKCISLSALDTLSVNSYPLCMRHMHETLRKTHHLRHLARLQYGTFLKGIGLTLEDSLKFWKEEFTKKTDIDSEKFEKNYAYSIRHRYGKEGKRISYTPHSCIKIITSNVSPGENHGCPFKHFDINTLKRKLFSYKLPARDIADILSYVSDGHYQIACTKYFEKMHNTTNAMNIIHPNQYFEESQKLISLKTGDYNNFNDSLNEKMMSIDPVSK